MGLFHIHWMVKKFQLGANVYYECRCGKRGFVSIGGYSPIDRQWLENRFEGKGDLNNDLVDMADLIDIRSGNYTYI